MTEFSFSSCMHFTLTSHVTCVFSRRWQGKKYLIRLQEQPGGEKAFPELSQTLRRHCHRQATNDIDTIYTCVDHLCGVSAVLLTVMMAVFFSAFSLRCQAYLRQNYFREVSFDYFSTKHVIFSLPSHLLL